MVMEERRLEYAIIMSNTVTESILIGGMATFDVYALENLSNSQVTESQICVVNQQGADRSSQNAAIAGWTADGYKSTGCYDTSCVGFVPVKNAPIRPGDILDPIDGQLKITIKIFKNKDGGDWWLHFGRDNHNLSAVGHVSFRFVEDMHTYGHGWVTIAKIVTARIKVTRMGDLIYHAILADTNGDKMEAIAYQQLAERCNTELHVGEVYYFKRVGFQISEAPPPFGLFTPTDYYIHMDSRTEICPAHPNIRIPELPTRFANFEVTTRIRNKSIIDVQGIVIHVSPVMFHNSNNRRTPCRDVFLMNTNLKGAPEYEQPEKDGDTSGVLMWDKNGPPPAELSQGSKTIVTDSTRNPKQRLLFDTKREIMARMCDCWPGMEFHVSACNSMDPSKRSSERSPFKDLSNSINTSVADTSNGGEPTDGKERNRQRRQIYAQMDPQKKEELLKKRRESYQRKKAKLQSTQSVTGTQESSGGPSALTQLESTPAVKGDTATNTENVVAAENEAYQGQQSLVTVNKENEVPLVNKEIEVPSEDDEWLRRNDNYKRQSIHMPFQGQTIIPTANMENCGSNEPTSSRIQPPVVDCTEKKRERERERYAQMNTDGKNELLARRNATYQQKRSLSENIEKMRARDRLRYADMSPKKKRDTTPPTYEIVQQLQTQSPANGEDEGVILEEDSEDEEGYMFAGQGNLIMFQAISCTYCT
ncbi:hypothetical protein ACQ4PT_008792 [Festuca glaucescens]